MGMTREEFVACAKSVIYFDFHANAPSGRVSTNDLLACLRRFDRELADRVERVVSLNKEARVYALSRFEDFNDFVDHDVDDVGALSNMTPEEFRRSVKNIRGHVRVQCIDPNHDEISVDELCANVDGFDRTLSTYIRRIVDASVDVERRLTEIDVV